MRHLSENPRGMLLAAAAFALAVAVTPLGIGTAPPALAAPRPLSGTITSYNHTITYSVGGASVPTGALAAEYDGVVTAGAGVWFSGSAKYVLGDTGCTRLSQSASLGSESKNYSQDPFCGPAAHELVFNLSVTAPASGQPDSLGVIDTIYARAGSVNCGGGCEGFFYDNFVLKLAVVTGGTTPTPPPTTPGDSSPPVVTLKKNKHPTRTDDPVPMTFTVTDDSGKAAWYTTLYSNGATAAQGHSKGFPKARGQEQGGEWSYPADGHYVGPFYQCVWAQDVAGNKSAGAPFSACRWLSVQVRIPKVSNGCGGSNWGETGVELLNWIGDLNHYGGVPVDMRPACNQHDAAYAGVTVAGMRTKKLTDYRTWSRDDIDTKLGQDLKSRCNRFLKGPPLKAAHKKCVRDTHKYLALVREFGAGVYDADVTTWGSQTVAPAVTVPRGGSRHNN